MKPGKILKKFFVRSKNGKKLLVVFRFPSKNDARKALAFVNKVRGEADFLAIRKRETLASEKLWLYKTIKMMKQNKVVHVFVESGKKIVGIASVEKNPKEAFSHVGTFGIALLEDLTGLGIGAKLGRTVLNLAKRIDILIVESGFFASNKPSRALHKKLGFKEYGILPKGCKLKRKGFDAHVFAFKFLKKP